MPGARCSAASRAKSWVNWERQYFCNQDWTARINRRRYDRSYHHVLRLTARVHHSAFVTIAKRPLCPEILAECANGRLIGNRPLLELSPLRPKGDRACLRARDSSGVFLNPNSCKGFEPAPSKEGSG